MKILKIILFSILGLIVFVFLAIFIFIKSYDVNKQLPQITQQVGKAINRQVNIGHANLDLAFSKGLSLELKNITISDDQEFSRNNFLTLDSAYVGLDVGALLLKQQISVTDVILTSAQISIVRRTNGSINAQTMAPASSSSNTAPSPAVTLPAVLIRSIAVKNAQLIFEDQNTQMPLHVLIRNIEIQINDFSLKDPFDFTVSANAWGQEGQKNILISGHCVLDLTKSAVQISDLQFKSDLSQWDWGNVRNLTPMLQTLPVWPQAIKGKIAIEIPQLNTSAKGLEGLSLSIALTEGYVKIKELLSPVEQISLSVETDLNNLSIKQFEAHIGSGQINAQGDFKGLLTVPTYTFQLQSKSVKVQDLLDQSKSPAEVEGELVGQFSGSGKSFDPQAMLENIKGEGNFALNNAKVEKLNILKTILDKINFLPGNLIQNAAETALPANIKSELDTDTTVLDKAQSKIKVENKVITLTDTQVDSKLFSITAAGSVDFDMNTSIDVKTYLASDISAAMVKAAGPLQGLLDEQNRLYIPGKLTGKAPSVNYQPQTDYITKKVAVSEGAQQLQKVLNKNPAVQNIINSITGQSTNSQDQGDSTTKSINGLLNNFLH